MLNLKKDFVWFKNHPDWIYADSGATSLKPQVVVDAIYNYLVNQSTNPHNNDSQFTHQAHQVMDECRQACAKLINANENEIIFTSGATESLNLIAHGISDQINKDDEIILTYYEHSSNLLPWYKLAKEKGAKIVFVKSDKFGLDANDFLKVFSPKTKVVSFIGVSNVLGNELPIKEITKITKKYNANILVCVDIAQMIPHLKCDMQEWNVDFAAFSGHKIFSDTGVGVAFIKQSLQKDMKPYRYGGGMNTILTSKEFVFASKYEKFEGGTPNISGIYSLLAAVNYLQSIGYENIHKHENEIFQLLYDNLKDLPHIEVFNWEAKSSILAFNVKGVFSQDTAGYFGKQNIIVRSGFSCSKLLNEVVNCDGVVRASFYIYNTKDDILKFIDILKQVTKEKILRELI